jgi:hypothetical protein
MEVHLTAELEEKLNALASVSGRGTDELVQDAVAGLFEELVQTREMLDNRYDDLKSGRVKPIPGDEVVAYFREKSAAARRSRPKCAPDERPLWVIALMHGRPNPRIMAAILRSRE